MNGTPSPKTNVCAYIMRSFTATSKGIGRFLNKSRQMGGRRGLNKSRQMGGRAVVQTPQASGR
jgi:hypothetical protein